MISYMMQLSKEFWDKDIEEGAQKTNGDPFPKDEYIAYLKQNLGKLCGKSDSEWDYNIPDPQTIGDQIDRIMNGYDDIYEELIRAVCSVMVFLVSCALVGWGRFKHHPFKCH